MSKPEHRWFLDGAISVLWWCVFVVLFALWVEGYRMHYAMLMLGAFQFGRLLTLYVVTGRWTGTAGSLAMGKRP